MEDAVERLTLTVLATVAYVGGWSLVAFVLALASVALSLYVFWRVETLATDVHSVMRDQTTGVQAVTAKAKQLATEPDPEG